MHHSPFTIIPIKETGYHLLVSIKIANISTKWIIDTGASNSVIDINFVKTHLPETPLTIHNETSSGISESGITSYEVTLPQLSINTLEIHEKKIVSIDLSHIQQLYNSLDLPMISGILGSDILYQTNALINYKDQEITFETLDTNP